MSNVSGNQITIFLLVSTEFVLLCQVLDFCFHTKQDMLIKAHLESLSSKPHMLSSIKIDSSYFFK